MAIDISQLANEINRTLAEYANGVGEEMEKVAEKVAKEGAKRLKVTSPVLTKSYAKGWRAKKVDGKWIVHNATDYQLTHLLENGHAKVGGGRVAPVKHIEPVEQQAIEDYIKGVEEVLQ